MKYRAIAKVIYPSIMMLMELRLTGAPVTYRRTEEGHLQASMEMRINPFIQIIALRGSPYPIKTRSISIKNEKKEPRSHLTRST